VGFIRSDSGGPEFLVRPEEMGEAVHGDRVEFRQLRASGPRTLARVVKVLAREPRRLAGIVHRDGPRLLLEPIVRRFPVGILAGHHPDLHSGGRIVALLEGGRRPGKARYRLLEQLGDGLDPRDDARDIALEVGLRLTFSNVVVDEARRRANEPLAIDGRTDGRGLEAITIDPEDAADFDDALSWRLLPGGLEEVGIHIADVAWYVERGGPVDVEAEERGTSVYLPGLVLPMLPEPLSSGAASLRPEEERYTVSVLVELDREGRVRDWRLERSLIRSRRRLTYAEAEGLLAEKPFGGGGRRGPSSIPPWLESLRRLGEITEVLHAGREARGGLTLDIPEYRVHLDELGRPLDLIPRHQGTSHRLVEELMLLANELVGGWARSAGLPILFRVHERPRWEKLLEFGLVLDELGIGSAGRNLAEPEELRRVVTEAEERGLGTLVSTYLLRALEKARYAAEDLGHFGLGVEGYTHFTSPIRRYPDLHTHRVLIAAIAALGGGSAAARRRSDAGRLLEPVRGRFRPGIEDLGVVTTAREVAAQDAERTVVRVKGLRLLIPRLGEEMDGIVTATLPAGFFVTLDEVPVDGFVARDRLPTDRYDLGPRGYSLSGRRTGIRFALGQRVRVRIERVSVLQRELDLSIVGGAVRAALREGKR
jgi:ribonuclease R